MILTKAQALKGDGRMYETVFFKELDGELVIASLSASAVLDLNDLRTRIAKGETLERQMLSVMLKDAIVDEKHNPFFDTDAEVNDFLLRVSAETLAEISAKIPDSKNSARRIALGNDKASPASSPTV